MADSERFVSLVSDWLRDSVSTTLGTNSESSHCILDRWRHQDRPFVRCTALAQLAAGRMISGKLLIFFWSLRGTIVPIDCNHSYTTSSTSWRVKKNPARRCASATRLQWSRPVVIVVNYSVTDSIVRPTQQGTATMRACSPDLPTTIGERDPGISRGNLT